VALPSSEHSSQTYPSIAVDHGGGVVTDVGDEDGRPPHRASEALHALVPMVIVALWSLTIQDVPLGHMTDLGLISVLPASSTILIFALTGSFCLSLRRRPLRPLVPLLHVLALIVLLYGVTAFIEAQPRFSSVYRHVGIIGYIAEHRAFDPTIDAYFSWGGFFTLGAFITQLAGFSSPMALAPWGPLAFNLLFLAPLAVILRWAANDRRVVWGGLWVFYSTNWVGQDYISPQAVGFLLWLSILGALLVVWTPPPAALAGRLRLAELLRSLSPRAIRARMKDRPQDADAASAGGRVALFLVVVLIYTAIVTGHQLTPVPAVLSVAGLVLFAGLQIRRLPMIMVVILAAWISYMTTQYLIGHIGTLAGPVGSVGENLNQNVSGRIKGSADHQLIVNGRLAVTAGIWILALLGFARRVQARRADVAMVVVGVAPFMLPILQPYGGEILLRVFLFSLPAVAFFISSLAFPTPQAGRTWGHMGLIIVVGCGLLWAFQYTRYGNERLDYFTAGDAAAVKALYRVAPKGARLYAGTTNVPWRYRGYADYEYRFIDDLKAWQRFSRPNPLLIARELQKKVGRKGGYVIVTRSTKIDAELLEGKPHALDWLVDMLRILPSAREVYHGADGVVFALRPPGRRGSPGSARARTDQRR
jgi:hypothetical protein